MKGEADRLHARNLQLKATISAIRDIAEEGRNEDKHGLLKAIKAICDEQLARKWDDPEEED